jgi:hypothetical protein
VRVNIDDDELHTLELDLSRAPLRIQFGVKEALATRAAPLVEREMRRDATGHQGNWFGKPGTSYDTPLEQHVSSEMIRATTLEVGIEKVGAGKLAHIIVFGSVNNAPVYDHMAGPRRAMPRVVKAMADQAEEDVLGRDRS